MAHKKETPRQKMIGMMYLVLTALLALNVSREVLNAFAFVDNGLSKTTQNFTEETNILYGALKTKADINSARAGQWYQRALSVKHKADSLYNYIQSLKVEIISKADRGSEAIDTISVKGKKIIKPEEITSKDNMDIPAQIMIGSNNDRKAKVLKQRINTFREYVLGLVKDSTITKSIESNLSTKDPGLTKSGEVLKWEIANFESMPLIAVTTILSKIQNDVRNTETEVVRYLSDQITASDFKFNKVEPITKSNSDYILRGAEYRAEVFLAAFDTTQRPTIFVGPYRVIKNAAGVTDYEMVGTPQPLETDSRGRGIFSRPGGSPGNVTWGGIIQMKNPDGTVINKPFQAQYQVGEAQAVISPTKMNVFYLAVDNPVDISVSGVPANKVFASMNNGVLVKSGGSWIAKPRQLGKTIVIVDAEIDGKRKTMGRMEFRVKQIPDPIAKVGGKKSGGMGKNDLAAQQVVVADLENFDFDARFTVTQFTVSAEVQGFLREFASKSNRITEEQRSLIRGLNKGQRVTFTDIQAVGPDGRTRELNGIIIKLQ
jgi:gliding motility-associated protein GldM